MSSILPEIGFVFAYDRGDKRQRGRNQQYDYQQVGKLRQKLSKKAAFLLFFGSVCAVFLKIFSRLLRRKSNVAVVLQAFSFARYLRQKLSLCKRKVFVRAHDKIDKLYAAGSDGITVLLSLRANDR